MRTKTLLIGAAALATSVISSQAQGTVYSQNVVGYINTPIPSAHYALFANQLVNGSDANQTNNNVNTVIASGMVSSPSGNSNTVLLVFSGGQYNNYYYYNAADAKASFQNGTAAGWYDGNANPATIPVPQGTAQFLYNNFSAPITATITGTVLQGTNILETVPTGYSLIALGTPISTNIDAAGIGLPDSKLTSSQVGNNDQYLFWTGSQYNTYYFYNSTDAKATFQNGTATGFYDGNANPCQPNNFPAAGQGFLYYHQGAGFTYTNVFTVQ